MQCRNSRVIHSCLLALSMTLMLSLMACSGKGTEEHNVSSLQLVWLTVDYWVKDCMTEERLEAINQRLHELGCDFEVSFQGIPDDTYENYQEGIEKAKKKGQGDLMWTGLGDGDAPEKEGTYYRQIRLGNLMPLDEWLKSDSGKALWNMYIPLEWKRITYKNKIYGVRNVREQGIFTSLILTDEQNDNKLNGKSSLSKEEFCQWLEEYRKNPQNKFYLDWRYVDDYNTSFSELGYIKLCDGIYMTPDGKVENVWENKKVCQIWNCFARMRRDGQLICDDSEELAETKAGNYPAALVNVTGTEMDGSYLYQPDGTKVAVQSYTVAVPYLNRIQNDVHGVTTWSRHLKEAMQLLTLVNTDEKLANLLYFGEEGKDYELKDGTVYSENHTDTYCPANPKITHFSIYEAKGTEKKESYYQRVNERYEISPADGFVPDLKKAGAEDDLLKSVETFYKTLLESDDDPKQMIRDFQKKLKKQRYESVLKNVQRQYNKWKKRRNKVEK